MESVRPSQIARNTGAKSVKVGHYKKTNKSDIIFLKSPVIFQEVHGFHPCKANGGVTMLGFEIFEYNLDMK